MNYYIIFKTEDRQVFVSKKEDLDNIDECVNMFEGIDRAPAFNSYYAADSMRDELIERLKELRDDGQYCYGFFCILPLDELITEIRLLTGLLGEFGDVTIEGNDVTLTCLDDDEEDEGQYTPRVYASIVDGVLYVAKEIIVDNEYETRIVWVSNRFTIAIKETEES